MDPFSASHNGSERPAGWFLRLYGGFELSVLPGGGKVLLPGKRDRVLLAYLALSPNCREPRNKLAALLWGDAADETALDNLRVCIWSLRKALGDAEHHVIASEGEDIVFDSAAFEVDVLAFRRLAAQSGRTELEAAAALCSGEFLDGLDIDSEEFESWRREEATRCRDQAVGVLSRLMTLLTECGETVRATETGERILRLEPLHEAAVRQLMRHHRENGRRGAAAQLYRRLADRLKTELDAQPEAETRAVFAEIARGGEEWAQAPGAPAARAEADAKTPPQVAPQHAKARTLNWILAGTLAAVLAIFLLYELAPPASTTTAQQLTGGETAKVVPSSPAGVTSIAVLPFTNLSSDMEQEFFSDGITEEITSALAKVPGLIVIGRTSAFQFKGQNQDLRAIGQALGTTHLIEGSVRKAGNRVRISAQLIQADTGAHLWTENYDRDLTDIFAIQEDIAQAIAGALRVPLGLHQGERLVSSRSIDPESYQQYLRAKALVRSRAISDGTALLEKVVARDANYAPAWALLAQAYALTPTAVFGDGSVEELRRIADANLPRADAAARRAIQLDASGADGYSSLGLVQNLHGNLLLAAELYSKALGLDPNNPDALHRTADLLADLGRLKEALAVRQQLHALEPLVPVFERNTGGLLWLNGQTDAAVAMLKALPSDFPTASYLAVIYAAEGRYRDAADILAETPSGALLRGTVEDAIRLLRIAPKPNGSPQSLPRLGILGFVYFHVGAPERMLEFYERNVQAGYILGNGSSLLWHPVYAPLRKTERFKAYLRAAGRVEYWRAGGWPDLCRPMGADDFVCD